MTDSIQVCFTTKLNDYAVEDTPVDVPSSISKGGLAGVLGSLFEMQGLETEKEWDFMVNGELLRTNLEEFLRTHDLTQETIVNVEYFEPAPKPEAGPNMEHDDWISSVAAWAGQPGGAFATGSYDGIVRVWKADGTLECALGGAHTAAVKDVACMTAHGSRGLVSAGKDHALYLWNPPEIVADSTPVVPYGVCREHQGSVDAVAVDPTGSLFCSASWDKTLKIWQAPTPGPGSTTTGAKRRKAAVPEVASRSTLEGHSEAVTATDWPEPGVLYSGGWDHTIREWDASSTMCTRVMHYKTVIHSIVFSKSNGSIASSHGDKTICLWDPRRDTPGPTSRLVSHKGWVARAAWAPSSDYFLASASYDGTALLWDTRSPKVVLYLAP